VRYASLVSRTIAYLLDTAIVAFVVSATVAFGLIVALVTGVRAHDLALATASAYVIVLPSVLAIYCALFWLLAGRTPGMALLGLRVVRTDGQPVRWFAAFLRGVLLVYFPIGALWLVVDRRRQAVHDKVARTLVVRAVPASPAPVAPQVGTGPNPFIPNG
jgi:uncharacterized RDD family membrane protein YckC